MSSHKPAEDWYSASLSTSDIVAGGTLLSIAIFFLPIYTVNCFVLYFESHVITGFLYLLSASINNIFLLINFALYPSILIMFKIRAPEYGRRIYQVYLDTMWFAMCYHTLLIAWTRYAAVCRPCQFRKQQNRTIYVSCFLCYVIGFVQSIVMYSQSWYVTFYYESSAYGMIPEDLKLYLEGGKSQFFLVFHSLIFIGTFSLYGYVIFFLVKYHRQGQVTTIIVNEQKLKWYERIRNWSILSSTTGKKRAEAKLIVPCICNALVFLIGQLVITFGLSESSWTTWLVSMLFSLTASTDSLTILIFNSIVRRGTLAITSNLFCCGRSKTKVVATKVSGITFGDIITDLRLISARNTVV